MSLTSFLTFAILSVVFGAVFFGLGYFVRRTLAERKIRMAELYAQEIRATAEREAERKRAELNKEADKYLLRLKQEFDEKIETKRHELEDFSQRISDREKVTDREVERLRVREVDLLKRLESVDRDREEVDKARKDLQRILNEESEKLQKVSGLSSEEARRQLLRRMETEVRVEASRMIKTVEEEAKSIADKKAKNILALAIGRLAAEHSIESTVSVVSLPSDEMKGRIIGKEGRNIRTFEQATGVDVMIDDTPGAVVLSGFDPVRREVARIAMQRLIEDGRIHPSTIEETVGKVRQELEEEIRKEGEAVVAELGIGDMQPEMVMLVGRLRYRSSSGQNSLSHSKEVAYLMNVFAGELGIDPVLAKRAGLLHDIGKVASHEAEGPHALIGGQLARRYNEPAEVIHAIEAHHADIEPQSILPVLVQAADALSGARPGARRDSLEHYIRRLEKLEKVAMAIPGVEKVFAIQAGREIRVLVNPLEVPDNQMPALAREITRAVQENLSFPGQIRVTVIRETRATEFARSR